MFCSACVRLPSRYPSSLCSVHACSGQLHGHPYWILQGMTFRCVDCDPTAQLLRVRCIAADWPGPNIAAVPDGNHHAADQIHRPHQLVTPRPRSIRSDPSFSSTHNSTCLPGYFAAANGLACTACGSATFKGAYGPGTCTVRSQSLVVVVHSTWFLLRPIAALALQSCPASFTMTALGSTAASACKCLAGSVLPCVLR